MRRLEKSNMATGIERIAAKAHAEKNLKFTSLAHHITPQHLWDNLMKIPKATASGPDKASVDDTRAAFQTWSKEMIDAIHHGGYKAPAARRAYIPKLGKDELRPIAVPNIADRVLQKSVADILNQIYEQDFLEWSFGGRPGKNAHQAISTLHKAILTRKVEYIYEADLKNFFGTLNHGWVLRFIQQRVEDPRIISLIRRWLKAGVMEEGEQVTSEIGTVQGGPISVLISNIYLHYTLDLWIEKIVKPRMKGEIYYVRYLDDFILCFQYSTDAYRFQIALAKRLAKFGLSLEPIKTKLIRFGRHAMANQQPKSGKAETFSFLGFTFSCGKTRVGKFKVNMKTEKKRQHRCFSKLKELMIKVRHLPLKEQAKAINAVLGGMFRYYGVFGNSNCIKRLYYFVERYWHKSLGKRSQKGWLNWVKFRGILKHFPILKPKIHLPFKAIMNMASL